MSQSQSAEKSSPSSTISSNCESPPLTKISKNKSEQHIIQKPNALSPAVVFAQILLHILSENKKSNDYYKKISLNQDGHLPKFYSIFYQKIKNQMIIIKRYH